MSQNVYQLISLQHIDPPKKPLKTRKVGFVETYEPSSEGQAKAQTDRYLSCGNPYCEWKCPAHNYIPNWLKFANEGRVFEAAELSHQINTLPEVYRRTCLQSHLYEGSCTLNDEFGTVTIGNIERYINDKAFEMGQRPGMSGVKQTDKKVAIIGTGPTGLACADILTRNGVRATIFDRHPEIGGLLTFDIPAFKLEEEVVTRRREIFTGMGIEFKLNTEVGRDVQPGDLLSDYDVVFLGVGAYQSTHGGPENEDADGMYAALPFPIANTKWLMDLGEARDESFVNIEGKHVVILGGSDTVIGCVRTSVRRGAKRITCAYHRDEESMSGSHCEVENTQEEDIEFKFNVQPLGIEVSGNGKVSGVRMIHTEMGGPDTKGCRRAEIVTGSEHIVPADTVIATFGFRLHNMKWLAKHSVELNSQGRIITPEDNDDALQINNPKIFTGGDTVRGSDLVVTAVAEGRKTTDGITDWLEV